MAVSVCKRLLIGTWHCPDASSAIGGWFKQAIISVQVFLTERSEQICKVPEHFFSYLLPQVLTRSKCAWFIMNTMMELACMSILQPWITIHSPSHGDKGWKSLGMGSRFSVFSTIQEKINSHAIWDGILWGYTTAIITALHQVPTCDTHGPTPTAPNSWSRMFMLRVKTLSAPDCQWRNSRKKENWEHSNIYARVSVHWRAQYHTKWQRSQHPAGIEPVSPDWLLLASTTKA